MTEDHWFSNSWLFDLEKLEIRVSHGNPRATDDTLEVGDFDNVVCQQSKKRSRGNF